MSRVTMFWHGGPNYAVFDTHSHKDAEEFASMAEAMREFARRAQSPYGYPCVESPEAWIIRGKAIDAVGSNFPDWILDIGPRGGVRKVQS